MTRVPLLAGSRLTVVNAPEGAVVLRPPPPAEAIADVGSAVRDALQFPLAGAGVDSLVPRGGRVTIVVELPSLPIPGSDRDPRRQGLEAACDELVRVGVPFERQTLLVAGGLGRRPAPRALDALVSPDFARRFQGNVVVHDVEDELVDLGAAGHVQLRVNRALVETDAVLVLTAAESVLHGGPAALLAATGAETLRAAGAYSLLETAASQGWELGLTLEHVLQERLPLIGVSLVLNHPRTSGALRGYPYDAQAVDRVARSPLRRAFGLLPPPLRRRALRALPLELTVSAAFAGPPSVAHAEALVRAIDARETVVDGPLDAICIGIPPTTPYLPRERPNPLLAAYLGLALALRLWRDNFPLVDGGTAILLHRFHRHFPHPTQQPYRTFFHATRFGREPEELADAELRAASDERAIDEYRSGRACHPLLPFVDWAACAPVVGRLGAVLIAGCRDSVAARQLGFVPAHGIGAALAMARAGGAARIGFLLAPPYFPLRVT